MSYFKKTRCILCGHEGSGNEVFDGCPNCAQKGIFTNYTTEYDFSGVSKEQIKRNFKSGKKAKGLWAYKDFYPLKPESKEITIGEGNTTLLHCERLGKELGLSNLYIKNESQNPTWSYKDRLCSVAVAKAVEVGAPVVTVSSTGNHGASAAAYAAAAGIPCVVFTIPQVPDTMKTFIQSYGASVLMTPTPGDRWKIMKQCVKDFGWYPISGYVSPPIGSNPYGIDGYKSIAFELYDELGELPEFIAVPSAYSDGLYGTWKGVRDLIDIGIASVKTRMIASEVYGSLKETLKQKASEPLVVNTGSWTVSFSISGPRGTNQGYAALRESNGLAETSSDDETMKMQLKLAKLEGIYAEASSVTTLVAIKKLAISGEIKPNDRVVAVITSSGLKDTGSTAKVLPEIPLINPDKKELLSALKSNYGIVI